MKHTFRSRSHVSAISRACCSSLLIVGAVFSVACGSDEEPALPWDEEAVTYRSPDGTVTQTSFGEDCGDLGEDECVAIQDQCGERGSAEVFLDDDGEVLEVVCFPADAAPEDVVLVSGGAAPPPTGNKEVIVLSGDAETPAIVGDLELDGNNVTIYGDDPATSILDGDLS